MPFLEPMACARWAFHGPPWAVGLEALCTKPWATAEEAQALAAPLGDLIGRLARHADAAFPARLPPPLEMPPEGRGVAWNALVEGEERELKLEAIGMAGGVCVRLSLLLPERVLALETNAPANVRAAMERDVEAMLGDRGQRKNRSTPPIVNPPGKEGLPALRLGGALVAFAIALVVMAVGGGFAREAGKDLARWWRLDRFAPVEGTVVAVRAVVAPEQWSKSRTASGDVVPEVEVAYDYRGAHRMTFIDAELRRSTPGMVRVLGERTWLGQRVTVHVDPKAPGFALKERELPAMGPLLRMLLGIVLFVPGAMLAVGVVVDVVWTIRDWRRRRR